MTVAEFDTISKHLLHEQFITDVILGMECLMVMTLCYLMWRIWQ